MDFHLAYDISSEIVRLAGSLGFSYLKLENIICFRSVGSKSKAVARIWALPRIWQLALSQNPHYCLEVISEKFDHLSLNEKNKVLIHELLHIPKNFSGALLSHNHNGRRIDRRTVERLFAKIK